MMDSLYRAIGRVALGLVLVCGFVPWTFADSSFFSTPQIVTVDSINGYAGGLHHVFMEAVDDTGVALEGINEESVALKISGTFAPFRQMVYRKQLFDLNTALLINLDLSDETTGQVINSASRLLISKKLSGDKLLLNFNGAESGPSSFYEDRGELYVQFQKKTYEVSRRESFIDFLLSNIPSFPHAVNRRQWLIVISEDIDPPTSETIHQWEKSRDMLMDNNITPLYVVLGENAANGWLFNWSQSTNGQFVSITSISELPVVMDKIINKLRGEYVLSYHLGFLGNKSHDLEVILKHKDQVYSMKSRVTATSVWPVSQTPVSIVISLSGLVLLFVGVFVRTRIVQSKLNHYLQPTFQILTPGEHDQLIPLEQKLYTLDFLTEINTRTNLRLSANLNKVNLSPQQNTFLLEDKNYKNALLINRRRIHRTLLQDGDILDIGEMTLLFRNPVSPMTSTEDAPVEVSLPVYRSKARGPIRKGIPTLVSENNRHEYFLIRSVIFIGSSDMNDLILKGNDVSLKHAKIVRIGGQYKIQNLSHSQEGTLVNNRRVEHRFLRDGDEIAIGIFRFKFRIGLNNSPKSEASDDTA
ncbi:MAG: FHA domain-containing protein [SAR324 cluster bacterium]|nr:FHA domain-containing protein [SAR324 cluster bacterium]